MRHKTINPPTLFNSFQFGFSQIVVTPPGRHVFISGQVSNDANGKIIGAGDLERQVDQSFQNLSTAVKSVGGTLDNIASLRLYIVNYQPSDSPLITDALKRYFDAKNPPTATWINVQGLANPAFMFEVEAQAVLP